MRRNGPKASRLSLHSRFRFAPEFLSRRLARTLDSLVRVTRRAAKDLFADVTEQVRQFRPEARLANNLDKNPTHRIAPANGGT